jgi:hypothetical protein
VRMRTTRSAAAPGASRRRPQQREQEQHDDPPTHRAEYTGGRRCGPSTGRRPPRECNEASQIHTAGGTMEPDRKASDCVTSPAGNVRGRACYRAPRARGLSPPFGAGSARAEEVQVAVEVTLHSRGRMARRPVPAGHRSGRTDGQVRQRDGRRCRPPSRASAQRPDSTRSR